MARSTNSSPTTPAMATILLLLGQSALYHIQPAFAEEVTAGPAAPVSLHKDIAYSTAKACGAGCLIYNGVFGCNNAGYYDLGVELGCGCGAINGCYCNTGYASSATKYVTECVSTECGDANWALEATSILALYDDYCATANVAVSTPGFSAGTTTKTTGKSNPTKATQITSGGGEETAATTDPTTPGSKEKDDTGLSKSDIIALAASLGVGIPSLLVALITLIVQLRKRKRKAAQRESGVPGNTSNVHLIHLHTSTPPAQQAHPHQYQEMPGQPHVIYDSSSYSYELDAQKKGQGY